MRFFSRSTFVTCIEHDVGGLRGRRRRGDMGTSTYPAAGRADQPEQHTAANDRGQSAGRRVMSRRMELLCTA